MARKRPPPFNEKDKIKILLWCERHCCLCDKACDTNIVIHHIQQKGTDEELSNIDNAIPLCYDCHGRIKSYNLAHRVGTSYRIEEIKARRNQIYDKYTRHLVPIVSFNILQGEPNKPTPFPKVITFVTHHSTSMPVRARVELKHILGGKDLGVMRDAKGYYSGETDWHLNPAIQFHGVFTILKECQDSKDDLKIEVRLTIIDDYGRPHRMLPQAWTYVRKGRYWFLEPCSFTKWNKSLPNLEPIDP
jgi:hypothetical protein